MLPIDTEYDALSNTLSDTDCQAYVHIGDRFDDTIRYLTRFNGPDRAWSFVYTPERSVLCAPSLFGQQAKREFVGDTVLTPGDQEATGAAARAVEVLRSMTDVGKVLVDESIQERDRRVLDDAFELTISNVDVGRTVKQKSEQERHARTQSVAQRGMARAESILAEATPDSDELLWEGSPLTTERLRREVNAVLSRNGVNDAGNTVIGAGESCADLHFVGNDHIQPHETVLLDISPRGPDGYYGDLTRTFVPGEVRGWEKETYDAVRDAQDAELDVLAQGAGIRAGAPHEAACDVLEARGYETGDVEVGLYHGVGHGIGISLHENPPLSGDDPLQAGNVVTVEPGIYDPGRGGVRIEDVGVVTENGFENLTEYPRSIIPRLEQ